jgi:hypothetical protein
VAELRFKDVWQQNDAAAERDAIGLWRAARAFSEDRAGERAKELCVVAYDGDQPVAVSTATIGRLGVVRQTMAFLRAFVAPDHRSEKIVVPLTFAAHESMLKYALANPQLRIGGTAGVVTSNPGIYKPIGSALMILIGYTPNDEPIIVRWFDHFRL